jgi:hypothetical protein
MRVVAAFASAVLWVCLGVFPSYAEQRVALVIGNNVYSNLPADQQLQKAVNDARTVGDALSGIGFQVIRGENLGRQALLAKFDELNQRLEPGDTAFFFFAGHGVAVAGGNYILPADVPNVGPGQDVLLARASLGENDIVSDLQGRGVRVAVVVLDACRNNPFKKPGVRAVGSDRGLGRIEPVRGVFTIYSAGIGQTALDRLGDADNNPNSVFTRVFVPALARPGVDLKELATEVREEVARLAASVRHDQRPAYYDETIGGRVYLAGLPREEKPPSVGPPDPCAAALDHWRSAEAIGNLAAFEDHVARFPNCPFAGLAKSNIAKATTPAHVDRGELARLLQLELRRVGCFDGAINGEFDDSTRAALDQFVKRSAIQLSSEALSPEAVKAVRGADKRVCPLVCQAGERAESERCVRLVCPAGHVVKDGSCVAEQAATDSGTRPAATQKGGSSAKCFTFQGRQFCE